MDKNNLLAMRPIIFPNISAEMIDGQFRLIIHHTSFLHRLYARLFRKAAKTTLTLDAYGTLVWQHCDGNYTVGEIARIMRERFDSAAEPVVERLVVFIRILVNNRLVKLHQPEN